MQANRVDPHTGAPKDTYLSVCLCTFHLVSMCHLKFYICVTLYAMECVDFFAYIYLHECQCMFHSAILCPGRSKVDLGVATYGSGAIR